MTQEPLGQGWWQASDGLWYPPETHPAAARPEPPRQLGPPPLPPQRRGGGRGCIVAVIIVMAILTVLGIGVVALISIAGRTFQDTVGRADCSFVTDEQVSSVLGRTEVFQFGSVAEQAAPALDRRALTGAETTCWGTSDTGRSALLAEDPDGGAAGFDAELAKSRATSQQRDDGITVETTPYYLEAVRGLGDEAFCTTADISGSAGVLVRQGERLVYVSVTRADTGGTDLPLTEQDARAGCADAQKLARLVLG